MAKNEPITEVTCPRCENTVQMKVDKDIKLSTNITVLECPIEYNEDNPDDENSCGYRFAKDQSVKLPGSLVYEAAECMESLGVYSSLGEFVRECVRTTVIRVQESDSARGFGQFMSMIAEDPETWQEIIQNLSESNEGENK